MTAVDRCESEQEAAYRVNAAGPHNLALAARRCGAALLHVSTDYVFDGSKGGPYDELDPPNPLSVYGRSKLGGEERVREILPEHFVVRTGYVFGSGRDHLTRSLDRLRRGEEAGGITDRIGSPTYVVHLAERLPAMAGGDQGYMPGWSMMWALGVPGNMIQGPPSTGSAERPVDAAVALGR